MSSSLTIQTKRPCPSLNTEPVGITGRPNPERKRSAPFKDTIRRHPTLKKTSREEISVSRFGFV